MNSLKALRARAEQVWCQGFPGTNSKRHTQYPANYPHFLRKQERCYSWDYDGNRYLDFVMGLGSSILGYNHPKVTEAVKDQLDEGYVNGSLPSFLEIETAEEIQSLVPTAERIRFLKTGSEACSAAIRIARAYTNCPKIYSDGYHGHHDAFTSLTEPAIGVKDTFQVFPYEGHLDWGAGLILEPVELEMTDSRKACLKIIEIAIRNKDTLLIYDEIITGFRVEKYTVSKFWNLNPDIICLGKAMANGYPLACVAGKADIMNNAGEYFISSTFSGEAISLAACKATLQELRKKDLKELMYYGDRLRTKLNDIDKDIIFEGYGTRAMLNITHPKTALFCQEACKAGILFGKAWFYTFAHMEENIEEYVLNVCHDVISRINKGHVKYIGELPHETFKR